MKLNNNNDFEKQTDHIIRARRPDLAIVNKKKKKRKKRTCRIVDFAVLVNHKVNIKENHKRVKYWDLARELKKLRNMMVTVILIMISALRTTPKGLVNGLEVLEIGRRAKTI